ncbi:MAG: CBS domain-containing protein [Oscillatoria sp. SIO1A7]|nr:CBS domain-containing protein [Oscillatoria sp. SIO1A7]
MTPRVITLTLSEREDIFTALSMLRQHRIRHLPIMHPDGRLLGIVTPQTIRRALQPANIVTKLRYVKDVMMRNVVCAPASDSVLDLARAMALHKISCVIITETRRLQTELSANSHRISEAEKYQKVIPVGIVTERDIVQFQALGLDLGKMRSSDVMSAPLFCLKPEDTLWFAHEEMQRRRVRRLVVVGAAGELLGIVSQTNLLQALEPTEMYSVIELLQRVVEDRTKELKEANQQLKGEVEERRKAEAALQKAHDELQKKVEERTAKLQKANRLLKKDIVRREQVEAALRESEAQSRSQAEQLEKTLHKLHATQMQLIQAEKMSSLGQLVAGIAHEINNPVNFIYGNLAHANQYINEIIDLVVLFREHYPEPEEEISQEIQDMDLDFMIVDLAKILNSMRIGADRIRSIVLSLRNFSRLDESEMKEVDIHEGIESTLLILQHRLGEANLENSQIKVIKEYGKLPLVECYPGLLNQVFINILTNALDVLENQLGQRAILIHTSIGHGELGIGHRASGIGHGELGPYALRAGFAYDFAQDKIGHGELGTWGVSGAWDKEDLADNSKLRTQDLRLEAKNSEVETNSKLKTQNSKLKTQNSEEFIVIRIADNGPGMGEKVRNRLFEPFFTTKNVGKGTGLGLSISYQIVVEKHGGQIDCISAPGRGTEFRLEIPLRQSAPYRV